MTQTRKYLVPSIVAAVTLILTARGGGTKSDISGSNGDQAVFLSISDYYDLLWRNESVATEQLFYFKPSVGYAFRSRRIRKMNAVTIHSLSLAGEHGHNEDACLSRFHPQGRKAALCAVSDGQGGQPGGAAASALACEAIVGMAAECSPLRLHWPITWYSLARRADREVRACRGAGFCTLVALAATAWRVSGAACGDSAAVLSVGNEAARFLTSEQDKNPPVGSGKASFKYFTARVSPRKEWTLLLMTDGVWKFTGLDPIIEAAICRAPAPRIIDQLRKAAARNAPLLGRSMRDDFTVIVVQNRRESESESEAVSDANSIRIL